MFWKRWSWALVLLSMAGLLAPRGASAHPANEANIYHYLWLRAEPRRLTVEHATVVGGLLVQSVWPQFDRDGDHQLTPEEQLRSAREIASGLSLEVEGRRVPLTLEAQEFPTFQEFFGGSFPAIKLRLTAPLPTPTDSGLLISLRDETWPHFRGVFPDPDVRVEGMSAAKPVPSADGRKVELLLRPAAPVSRRPEAGASGRSRESAPGAAPALLPGLSLSNTPLTVPSAASGTPPGAERAAAPGEAPAGNRELDRLDLRRAPLFPKWGAVVYAAPRGDHAETERLKGFLGKRLSLGLMLLGLGAAVLAGMAHALTPGHGKAMVGAYLIGSRGTAWDAVLLGVVVTITHTLGVYILGFLCLWLTSRIRAEAVGQWLGVLSGVLVVGMGFWLFQRGLLAYYGIRPMPGHAHAGPGGHSHGLDALSHVHAHSHGHSHAHEHGPSVEGTRAHSGAAGERRPPGDAPLEEYAPAPQRSRSRPATKWDLIGLGVAGGIVPCFDALAILIAAVNLQNIPFGLALIAAFSVGLAAVLVAIGILMVKAKDFVARFNEESPWVRAMPAVSGAVLFFLGSWLTLQSLAEAGWLRLGMGG